METLDMITKLLNEQHKKQKDLTDFLGLGKNAFTTWKSGHTKSYKKYLPEIAEFFGVSVEYLLGRTNVQSDKKENPSTETDEGIANSPKLTPSQSELIRLFDSAPEHLRLAALAVLRAAEQSSPIQDDDKSNK